MSDLEVHQIRQCNHNRHNVQAVGSRQIGKPQDTPCDETVLSLAFILPITIIIIIIFL
jgi:hypothetical protein